MRAVELFEAKSSYGKCHWFFERVLGKTPLWFHCILWFLHLDSLHFKSCNVHR